MKLPVYASNKGTLKLRGSFVDSSIKVPATRLLLYTWPRSRAWRHAAATIRQTARPHSSSTLQTHRGRAEHCAMSWRNAGSSCKHCTVPSSFHPYSFSLVIYLSTCLWRCFDQRKKSWWKPKFSSDYISISQNKTVLFFVGFYVLYIYFWREQKVYKTSIQK